MDALKACGRPVSTDDGIPLMDEKLKAGDGEGQGSLICLSFHEEDPAFIINNGINKGVVSEQLESAVPWLFRGFTGSRGLYDCPSYRRSGEYQHISSRNSCKMVALAKQLGADVWAEVTPHHFTLDETAVLKHGTLAKMNPPLRTQKTGRP